MIIHGRDEWGARPAIADRLAHQRESAIREVFIHHSDSPGAGVHTFGQAAAIVRGLQAFHMDGRGWADIAYHFIIVQNAGANGLAWVFAGRPLSVVPAAQLDHNSETAAICIVQKDPEPLLPNTRWRAGRLAKRVASARHLRGHYEVTATSCPGPIIRAELDEIARVAGKAR